MHGEPLSLAPAGHLEGHRRGQGQDGDIEQSVEFGHDEACPTALEPIRGNPVDHHSSQGQRGKQSHDEEGVLVARAVGVVVSLGSHPEWSPKGLDQRGQCRGNKPETTEKRNGGRKDGDVAVGAKNLIVQASAMNDGS